MPKHPMLVIVCGLPATGKSTLATTLGSELGLPVFSKDDFKETFWESGESETTQADRKTSQAIGRQSIATLFLVARRLVDAGTSCVIESNFLPEYAENDLEPFTAIARVRQVHCTIPSELVLQRYTERSEAGERSAVHADADALDDLRRSIESGAGEPLPLSAPLLQVSTLDGYDPPMREIVAFCHQ